MKIEYSILNYNCPKCRYTVKQENTLLYILIGMMFLPITLLYGITLPLWSFIKNLVLKYLFNDQEVVRLGNKTKKCPICQCEVPIRIGLEWAERSIDEMKSWAYRRIYRLIIILLYCVFWGLIAQLVWFSPHSSDKQVTLVILEITVCLFLVALILYFCWKHLYNKEYILVCKRDFSKIQKSLDRTSTDINKEKSLIKIVGENKVYGCTKSEQADYSNYIKMLQYSKALYSTGAISAEEYDEQCNKILMMIKEKSQSE